MDGSNGELLRTNGLAFFGRIMAGQSHEINNVLNIINELAGLQRDLLQGAESGLAIDTDKLTQVSAKIQNQVKRGELIVREMNGFAHTGDCPVALFDLKEALNQIAHLAQRSVRLKKTLLETEFPENSVPLETSPFGFKHAVFYCIEIALAASDEQRRITLSYQVSDFQARITVKSADPIRMPPDATKEEAFLSLLARHLGGVLEILPACGDCHGLLLMFPLTPANSGESGAQA